MDTKTKAFEVVATNGSEPPTSRLSRMKLTEGEKKKLQDMIKKATSLEEIIRLEKMLNEGRLPAGIHSGPEAMEE
jgi:U2 small nuclear ribonucleoprotein A'